MDVNGTAILGLAAAIMAAFAGTMSFAHARAARKKPSLADSPAWALLAVSLLLCGWSIGWHAGIPVWLGILSLAGFGAVFWRSFAERGKARMTAPRRSAVDEVRKAETVLSLRRSAASLLTSFLFSVATLFALALLMPMEPAGRAALSMVLWPLVWTGVTLWLFASGAVLRSHLLTLLAGAGLFGLAALSFLSGAG